MVCAVPVVWSARMKLAWNPTPCPLLVPLTAVRVSSIATMPASSSVISSLGIRDAVAVDILPDAESQSSSSCGVDPAVAIGVWALKNLETILSADQKARLAPSTIPLPLLSITRMPSSGETHPSARRNHPDRSRSGPNDPKRAVTSTPSPSRSRTRGSRKQRLQDLLTRVPRHQGDQPRPQRSDSPAVH